MGIVKNSIVAMAAAGTLSLSAFAAIIKDESYKPINSTVQTRQKAQHIFSDEKIEYIKNAISAMEQVNINTHTIYIPAMEASLQRWVKEEDIKILYQVFDWIENRLNERLRQYKNIKKMLKNTNANYLLNEIGILEKMTRLAKQKYTELKKNAQVIEDAKNFVSYVNKNKIADIKEFWIPYVKENDNVLIVNISYETEEEHLKMEKILNETINSKKIIAITVA